MQQTLGHITAAASTNPPKWMARFAGTGFRFDTLIAKDIATQTAGGPAQTRALDELDGEGVDILRARM